MNITTIHNLNKLKNASYVNHELAHIDSNKLTEKLLKLLYKEGFILSYRIKKNSKFISFPKSVVSLRYLYNRPIFKNLKIISSPSQRRFFGLKNISRLSSKNNLLVFSTNLGLLTLNECKKFGLGGILLFIC